MSEHEVELVRRTVAAFNARDIDALQPLYREDFVYRLIGGFASLVGEEFVGREAATGWMIDWIETIEGRIEIEALHEVDGRVLAIFRVEGMGAASGAETSLRTGFVYSFSEGQISAVDGYYDTAEAMRAVGLEA